MKKPRFKSITKPPHLKPAFATFTVTSGYGGNTKRPFIRIEGPKLPTTMDSGEARALALNILEGALAAEADGLIVEFFTKELDLPLEHAGAILQQWRAYRARWRNEVSAA